MRLEILSCTPATHTRRPSLLFVHGAFAAAWCWKEFFLPWFCERGFPSYAVSLRGHGASPMEGDFDSATIDDYVADTIAAAAMLERPVLVGHSMGAIVVQRAARRCQAAGMVLLAPVPPCGLGSSWWSLAARAPPLLLALNAMRLGVVDKGAAQRLRDCLLSPSVSESDANGYLVRMRRESKRALIDLAWPQYMWIRGSIGLPALVLGAERDGFFTRAMTEQAAQLHGVRAKIFPDMAHAMMLEPRWRDVAQHMHAWLEHQLPLQE
ncbi:MAG: alpha/beta hydrolase [Burkholderiales bacterium]